jgi:hypothetical protein
MVCLSSQRASQHATTLLKLDKFLFHSISSAFCRLAKHVDF